MKHNQAKAIQIGKAEFLLIFVRIVVRNSPKNDGINIMNGFVVGTVKLNGNLKTELGENSPTWNGGKVKLTCLNCRQEFKVHPKRKDTAKFCSHKCLGEWRSKNWKGEDNPSWRGGHPRYYGENWEKQKRKALNRDSHTCQMCGAPENGQRHDVHHIKPIREFEDPASANSLDNLVTLCRSCHIKAETMREGEPRWKTKENS